MLDSTHKQMCRAWKLRLFPTLERPQTVAVLWCFAGDVWHIALPQCDSSLLYAYRVMGENQDKNNAPSAVGHKFDEVRGRAAAAAASP
jgi:pullulanase/glycogen debranching enzyme